MNEDVTYKQGIPNSRYLYVINYCFKMDRDASNEKVLRLFYFDPYYNMLIASEEEEEVDKFKPPSYFDQNYCYRLESKSKIFYLQGWLAVLKT